VRPSQEDIREALAGLIVSGEVIAVTDSEGQERYIARQSIVEFNELGQPIWQDNDGNWWTGGIRHAS
jgi:hypothetical protein